MNDTTSKRLEPRPGSELHLALVVAFVFAVIGAWPIAFDHAPRLWAVAVATLFVLLGLFTPSLLKPLNRFWFRLGMLLHAVVSPVVMTIIYCTTVVPTGLIMRFLGRDSMTRRYDRMSATYWIVRDPPGPQADSFTNQF